MSEDAQTAWQLPDGYVPVTLLEHQSASPLKVCVLVCVEPDPGQEPLVTLRENIDGRVLLGCITDQAGGLQRWVEIWMQDVERISEAPASVREALSNSTLDLRWRRQFNALKSMEPDAVITTGYESRHPLPSFIDAQMYKRVSPSNAAGKRLRLCEDDQLLKASGLPPFSTSLHRYLYEADKGEDSIFIPVTSNAPTSNKSRSLNEFLGDHAVIPMNAAGNLIMVRRMSLLSLESYIDVLRGKRWEGVAHGARRLHMGPATRWLSDNKHDNAPAGGRLFLPRQGLACEMLESFHLRLCVLLNAVEAVHALTRDTQQPLLNLSANSLQIRLAPPTRSLPYLWSAQVALSDPGAAVKVALPGTDKHMFQVARPGERSAYQLAEVSQYVSGRGNLRIRQIDARDREGVVFEGTLDTQEHLVVHSSSVARFTLSTAGGPIAMSAAIRKEPGVASGEYRFRTIPREMNDAQRDTLEHAAGTSLNHIEYEIMPMLSSACDLYSLAVVGCRALLVNDRSALPIALDSLQSLARQVANEYDPARSLDERIRGLLAGNTGWNRTLGPQQLVDDSMTPAQAYDIIPVEVWSQALAVLVRMLPAIGRDSICQEITGSGAGAGHAVYESAMTDLEELVAETRSLIVIDWRFNREVRAVIDSMRDDA